MVVGVAEPNDGKRRRFVERYMGIRGQSVEGQQVPVGNQAQVPIVQAVFSDWKEIVTEEGKKLIAEVGVDGMVICKFP